MNLFLCVGVLDNFVQLGLVESRITMRMIGIVECDNELDNGSAALLSVTASVSPCLVCGEHVAGNVRVELQPDLVTLVIDVPGCVQGTVPSLEDIYGNVHFLNELKFLCFST